MVGNDDLRERVRSFLSGFIRVTQLQDGDDIFALGVVNSLFAMQLVTFVESEFGVVVENDDLSLANFKSVDAVTEFVQRKKSVA